GWLHEDTGETKVPRNRNNFAASVQINDFSDCSKVVARCATTFVHDGLWSIVALADTNGSGPMLPQSSSPALDPELQSEAVAARFFVACGWFDSLSARSASIQSERSCPSSHLRFRL